jgi:hypothetical protein
VGPIPWPLADAAKKIQDELTMLIQIIPQLEQQYAVALAAVLFRAGLGRPPDPGEIFTLRLAAARLSAALQAEQELLAMLDLIEGLTFVINGDGGPLALGFQSVSYLQLDCHNSLMKYLP